MTRIYITGVSGVGKSSVSRELNKRGILSIDIDSVKDLCNWTNIETKEKVDWQPGKNDAWYDSHTWICDKKKMLKLLDQKKDVVVVGCAPNQEEYLDMFDKIFVLTCKSEIFIHRINNRSDNDYGKHELEWKKVLELHESDFNKDLVEKRKALLIDANKPLEDVVNEIVSKFD